MSRPLHTIASEILTVWKEPHFSAMPYIVAMRRLDNVRENYGMDEGRAIVAYFLSNAQHWRGEDARRIKAELREMLQ